MTLKCLQKKKRKNRNNAARVANISRHNMVQKPGVHFSKVPETFRAQKALLCAKCLPTKILFLMILKARH